MPSKYRVRPFFAPLVKFIARGFLKIGFTPNIVTMLMLGAALFGSVGFILINSYGWFAIWIFITGILDGVDGALARLKKSGNKFGGILDSVCDRVSEIIIFLGIFWGYYQIFSSKSLIYHLGWIILLLLSTLFSFMISYSRSRVENVAFINQIRIDSNIGMLGRSERLICLIICLILSISVSDGVTFWIYFTFGFAIFNTFLYRAICYSRAIKIIQN